MLGLPLLPLLFPSMPLRETTLDGCVCIGQRAVPVFFITMDEDGASMTIEITDPLGARTVSAQTHVLCIPGSQDCFTQ